MAVAMYDRMVWDRVSFLSRVIKRGEKKEGGMGKSFSAEQKITHLYPDRLK